MTPLATVQGKVIHGEKVGRQIGFPTANLDTLPSDPDLQPGVYFCHCLISNTPLQQGLAYFGPRLIFGEEHNCFEIFIYDYDGDLYGQTITVELLNFMRSPIKINSLEELKQLLAQDKKDGEKFLQDDPTRKQ